MRDHIDEEITVGQLAAVACLSPFHFIRMFRLRTGVPPHRYLSRLRLDSAKLLLIDGGPSLQSISDTCRFSSLSNFTRAFRRATGVTPRAYRNDVRF